MFFRLGAFIVFLSFTLSVAVPAEQNSVPAEHLVAKVEAEQDATRDVNKLLWFGSGIGIAVIGSAIGACGGCVVGSILNPEMDPYVPLPNTEQVLGTFVGSAIGAFAPLIGINNYRSNPPPKRLIGKSPEYVAAYTDAYIQKTRAIRTRSAGAGVATGCGLALLIFFVGD